MTLGRDAILLGTVALEPNRWGLVSPDRAPVLRVEDWLDAALAAGFDGVELWENHALGADPRDVALLEASKLPTEIWNSYVSLDEDDEAGRSAVAEWAGRFGCSGVKFNVGNDPGAADAYAERAARWLTRLPPGARLICECHRGTVADDPATAAAILSAAGRPERVQALVHLGDDPDYIDAMFDALGERIAHVHVNFLAHGAPALADIAEDVAARVERVRARGFAGSFTIEFVKGVGGEDDQPPALVEAALRDLRVLREVLGRCA